MLKGVPVIYIGMPLFFPYVGLVDLFLLPCA